MQHILLVEDEKDIRELYEQILSGAGFMVDTAQNGEEGYQKAKTGDYDLILLDIIMPKLDGLSVLKRLKLTPTHTKHQKIAVMTVLADPRYVDDALKSGADDYIIKSNLTPEQVIEKVKAILARESTEPGT